MATSHIKAVNNKDWTEDGLEHFTFLISPDFLYMRHRQYRSSLSTSILNLRLLFSGFSNRGDFGM